MIKSGVLIIFLLLLLFLPAVKSYSQTRTLDSLKNLLKRTRADTSKMKILFEMTDFEGETNLDSALNLVTTAEDLALKQKQKMWLAKVYLARGFIFYRQSLNDLALYYFMKGYIIFNSLHDLKGMSDALNRIALVYKNQRKYPESLVLFNNSLLIRTSLHDQQRISI